MDRILPLLQKKYTDTFNSSTIFTVYGESGIGKTYWIRQFLDSIKDTAVVIHFDAHTLDTPEYSTLNVGLYKLISDDKIKSEININILQKLSLWIPRFGEGISDLCNTSNIEHKSLNDIVRRSGINTDTPKNLEIIKFFESIADGKNIIIYCDNIQWYDKSSWETLLQIFTLINEKHYFCILSYTIKALDPIINQDTFDKQLHILSTNYYYNKITSYTIERWDRLNISKLCDSIIDAKTNFTDDQYDLIYRFSLGIPQYVKLILYSLKEEYQIRFSKNNSIESYEKWGENNIEDILKKALKDKLLKVYKTIPESKILLEYGSVLEEDFSNNSIATIFTQKSLDILREVEHKFQIIEYIIDNNLWEFEHLAIREYIYNSLGENAKKIHHRIAEYLENIQGNVSNIKIAIHYKLAGDYEKSLSFYIKEVESLLNIGCYKEALSRYSYIEDSYSIDLLSIPHLRYKALFLKGRLLFHTVQYQSAIETFVEILNEPIEEYYHELTGYIHQWLARAYLKLNTQKDFKSAIEHLEIAKQLFTKANDYSAIGDVLLDTIVAYAHMNRKDIVPSIYKDAERYFSLSNDRIGMFRLYRKCIIFMQPQVAAPILETVANGWKRFHLQHEEIMALNNAAVAYMNIHNYKKSKELLMRAFESSIDIDNFGEVYLYNNLGVLSIFLEDYHNADKNFAEARKGKYRYVEQLIVDINRTVVIGMNKGVEQALPFIKRTYKQALTVNENDYLIPATINLGIANAKLSNNQYACKLLMEQEPYIQEYYNSYIFVIWYQTLYSCSKLLNNGLAQSLYQKYNHRSEQYLNFHSNKYPEYAIVTMEFWSEN